MPADLVILDRDGVINAESPEHIKSVAEWRPLPGSLEAIARLNRAGWRTALATNQSGIARGLLDEAALAAIHAHINAELARIGGRLDPMLYSPDGPGTAAPRRKPRPGMLLEIAERLCVDPAGVPYVGDSARDIEAARAAGARPVLVLTGNGAQTVASGAELADVDVFDDLADFADAWLAGAGTAS